MKIAFACLALVAVAWSAERAEAAQAFSLTTTGETGGFEFSTTIVKPASAVRLIAPGCVVELSSGSMYAREADTAEIVIADQNPPQASSIQPGSRSLVGALLCPSGNLPDPTQFRLERRAGDEWRRDGFKP